MRYLIIIILLSVINHALIAQQKISGVVTDESGMAVPGANIMVVNSYDGTTSGADGSFSFTTDESLPLNLQITYIGYENELINVETPTALTGISVRLTEAINKLDAVVVSAGSFDANQVSKTAELSPIDISTTAGALGDVYGAINTLPGSTVNGESGKLFVRGGESYETKTFINGSLVQNPYGNTVPNLATRGRFSPMLFKGTFFSSGGYSAEHGQALSSVLALKTKDIPSTPETNISVMAVGLGLAHSQKIKETEVHAEVNYSDLGPLFSIIDQNFEWERKPKAIDALVYINQPVWKKHSIKSFTSYQAGDNALYMPDAAGNKVLYELKDNYIYSSLSMMGPLSESWNYRGSTSFTINKNDMKAGDYSVNTREDGVFGNMIVEGALSEKFELKAGVEYQYENYNISSVQEDDNYVASFAELTFNNYKWLGVNVGVRQDYSAITKTNSFSPRFAAAIRLSNKSKFSMAAGQYSQRLPMSYYIGVDKLLSERAFHYIANYQFNANKRLFRVEAWYKDYDQLHTFQGSEYQPLNMTNDGYGYAKGLDIWWRDRGSIPNADYWISYSFIDSKRKFKNYPTAVQPEFIACHNFNVVYKHFVPALQSQVGFNVQYNDGRPYNNPNKDTFQSEKTKYYATLNLNWAYLYRSNIILYGAVTNVLGRKNEFGYQYTPPVEGNDVWEATPIIPTYDRFYFIGLFITISGDKTKNQLDTL